LSISDIVNFSVTATCALNCFGQENEHFHGHDCRDSGHTVVLTWNFARSVTDLRYFLDYWM